MKRLFATAVALVAFSSASFATNNYDVLAKQTDDKTFKGITRYLETTGDQDAKLKIVFAESKRQMKRNSDKAMSFNLGATKAVLSQEQYKKYLLVLNMSLLNENRNDLIAEK